MDNEYNNGDVNFVLYDSEPKEEVTEAVTEEVVEETKEMQETQETMETIQIAEDCQKEEQSITYNYNYADPTPVPAEKEEKKKSNTWKKWVLCVCMAIVFGLIASAVFQTSNFIVQKMIGVEETPTKSVGTTLTKANSTDKELTGVAEVAANVMPSVVSITNLSVQEVENFFWGTTTQEYESRGSGIIVGQNDTELLIVSNNHVVEGSNSLTVSFIDGSSVEGLIKGTDANIDLAVVAVPLNKISSETLEQIKIATLGDSDALVVGETAIAIGNALGYGQSVTRGIISALDREIEGFDSNFIQTDAAINPGNSGGALVNGKGEVIGINTVKVVQNDMVEGMGYAIPISDVNDVISELMNRETRSKVEEAKRGVLGIRGIDVDESGSRYYGMPEGVYVSEIIKGGGAEKAGLPKGCIITKFEGSSIKSMNDLQEQLKYYKAGETVKVTTMMQNGNGEYVEKVYEITLGEQSASKN